MCFKKQGRPSGGLNKATIIRNKKKLAVEKSLSAKSENRANFVADNSPGMALRIRGVIETLDINCCTWLKINAGIHNLMVGVTRFQLLC